MGRQTKIPAMVISPGSTSSQLLRRLAQPDSDAWQRMCDLYCPLIYLWCRQAGVPSTDIPDLAQEILLAVYKSFGRYEHESYRGWLWGITRNHIKMHFRKQQHSLPVEQNVAPDTLPEDPSHPDDHLTRAGLLYHALKAIRSDFSETTWAAFMGLAIEKRSVKDLADELDMKPTTVKQAKFRVLQRLRDHIHSLENFGNSSDSMS